MGGGRGELPGNAAVYRLLLFPWTIRFSAPSPSQGIPAAYRGFSSHNYNVFLAKRTAGNRQFPPLRGNQGPEHFPFSTLGVGGARRHPLAQHLPDHVPGSSFISYTAHRCSVEVVWSNVCGKCWVHVKQASSDFSTIRRHPAIKGSLWSLLCHWPHVSIERWKCGWWGTEF